MKARAILLVAGLAALPAGQAAADCTCRAQGREFDLGQTVCLAGPKGPRLATCGMVLNNTSWQFTETPCAMSAAPPASAPAAHSHDATATKNHHGG